MKYYSISQYPGTTGKYYYTYFFDKCNIDAIYSPIGADQDSFTSILDILLLDSDTKGISVSMPFKQTIIQYLNSKQVKHSDNVLTYNLANTVVVDDTITTHNTDLNGVIEISKQIPYDSKISILGNGSMGKMFYRYLQQYYRQVIVYSRSLNNWNQRHTDTNVVINCSSLGTINDSSCLDYLPKNTELVIDLSVTPGLLMKQSNDVKYIDGLTFYHYQFIEQFYRYTGIRLEYNDVVGAGNKK